MTLIEFFSWFEGVIALPAVIVFFGVAFFLTLKTGVLQVTGVKKFGQLLMRGLARRKQVSVGNERTINPFHALCTAMGTTIGMGNLTGPPIAVYVGGPGALFWLLIYIFFSAATKFTETTFAVHTRTKTDDGYIIGGPMRYLHKVHPFLSAWYTCVMLFLFISWSTVQSNTLAQVFMHEGVPAWITGALLASVSFLVLLGGSKRIGALASKLVPFMFLFYVSFALLFLFQDLLALKNACLLVFSSVFSQSAALGSFAGASVYMAMRSGLYKGVFITEAGMGTSSIPHAVAQVERPTDQGILALFSMMSDALLSLISGLLVIVSGVWSYGEFRSTLLYEVFTLHSPCFGRVVFLITLVLFVFTTVVGNSYNGRQVFGALTQFRGVNGYVLVSMLLVFVASIAQAKVVWKFMDFLLPFVAIPNLIGLLILAYRYPHVLKVK